MVGILLQEMELERLLLSMKHAQKLMAPIT